MTERVHPHRFGRRDLFHLHRLEHSPTFDSSDHHPVDIFPKLRMPAISTPHLYRRTILSSGLAAGGVYMLLEITNRVGVYLNQSSTAAKANAKAGTSVEQKEDSGANGQGSSTNESIEKFLQGEPVAAKEVVPVNNPPEELKGTMFDAEAVGRSAVAEPYVSPQSTAVKAAPSVSEAKKVSGTPIPNSQKASETPVVGTASKELVSNKPTIEDLRFFTEQAMLYINTEVDPAFHARLIQLTDPANRIVGDDLSFKFFDGTDSDEEKAAGKRMFMLTVMALYSGDKTWETRTRYDLELYSAELAMRKTTDKAGKLVSLIMNLRASMEGGFVGGYSTNMQQLNAEQRIALTRKYLKQTPKSWDQSPDMSTGVISDIGYGLGMECIVLKSGLISLTVFPS